MKIFKEFNQSGRPCPICNTTEKKETVLVITGPTENPHIATAIQVHLDCIPDLKFNPEMGRFEGYLSDSN